MRKANSSSTYDCDVDTFWKTFFSEEYNRKFFIDELKFRAFEVLSQSDTARRVRVVPTLNMPKPVMKILGDSFGYEEDGQFDKAKSEWRWKMIPNTMKDKLLTNGVVRVEPAGEGKCRRIDEVTLEAKVFGVGGLIESSTEKEIRSAWDKEASFFKRYLALQK